jgi:hypothetical protein
MTYTKMSSKGQYPFLGGAVDPGQGAFWLDTCLPF